MKGAFVLSFFPAFVHSGWSGWSGALAPSRCAVCAGTARRTVCAPCEADLAALAAGACCPLCGLSTSGGEICGGCLRNPPPFASTTAALRYAAPLDMLVTRFKFGGGWQLAEFLAELAGRRLDLAKLGDVAVAVPLHPSRERQRGFNQSRELARRLCAKSGGAIPLMEGWVLRVANTPRQTGMKDRAERRRNVRGAFFASPQARGRRVVVVDDVMTTGATLEEIARTLKRAGAKSVANAVLGRAQEKAR